jgi:hypothetical protein
MSVDNYHVAEFTLEAGEKVGRERTLTVTATNSWIPAGDVWKGKGTNVVQAEFDAFTSAIRTLPEFGDPKSAKYKISRVLESVAPSRYHGI